MAKARKKPETTGAQSPVVSPVPPESQAVQRYRFNRPHTHAGVSYAVGDTATLNHDAATRIRLYAGADAITHVVE